MGYEPRSNISVIPEAIDPHSNLPWRDKEPEFFVGKYVKKAFITEHPDVAREYMWIQIEKVEKGKLVGRLNNDPVVCSQLKDGDAIQLSVSEITMVMDGDYQLL